MSDRHVTPVVVVPRVPMETVEVTRSNLEAVVAWLGSDLGICEVRDGRIYANLYEGPDSAEVIDPGRWIVKHPGGATVFSAANLDRQFSIG